MITNSIFLVIILFIIVVPVIVLSMFVVSLLGFHVYLMIKGRTTKETLTKNELTNNQEIKSGLIQQDLKISLFTGVNREDEIQQEKRPYLCFALPLLKEEVDYLNEFDFCSTGNMKIVEM